MQGFLTECQSLQLILISWPLVLEKNKVIITPKQEHQASGFCESYFELKDINICAHAQKNVRGTVTYLIESIDPLIYERGDNFLIKHNGHNLLLCTYLFGQLVNSVLNYNLCNCKMAYLSIYQKRCRPHLMFSILGGKNLPIK